METLDLNLPPVNWHEIEDYGWCCEGDDALANGEEDGAPAHGEDDDAPPAYGDDGALAYEGDDGLYGEDDAYETTQVGNVRTRNKYDDAQRKSIYTMLLERTS
ncbi:hypothetical protein E2562_025380 [Oryza meyeriana var. granulata]|uniref:Uncharacterized protein n=1 Tax=Oryza meyeriana var. granulata TaxID=110450 RepID=A0A6G1DNE2_9ORYZ|nr:hypothetical protein E2562_025380 [Oryza meyeriana var. granulata]